MIAQGWDLYKELDPAKKDKKWANGVLTTYRTYWRPIVDRNRYIRTKNVLYGTYDMTHIKEMFDDEDFRKNTNFLPIGVWESIRNILTEAIYKNPASVEATATDPTAVKDKRYDQMLLSNRKLLENDLTQTQTAVGMNPYKMDSKRFKGNVDTFDQMFLNETNEQDVAFFFDTYFKLGYETAAGVAINSVFNTNKLTEKSCMLISDALAVKCMTYEEFVSELTGEIVCRYIQPNLCYGLLRTERDCSDAECLGYERQMNVWEFLETAGNNFDWDRDWPQLLWAINFTNNSVYTGFMRSGVEYNTHTWEGETFAAHGINYGGWGQAEPSLLMWQNVQLFNVSVGRMQFYTIDGAAYKVNKENGQAFRIPYDENMTPKSKYQKESDYYKCLYEYTYLATSTTSQFIVKGGPVYHQTKKEGYYDQYCGYTFKFLWEEGLSPVEVSMPFIELIDEAFYKMKFCVRKAKPDSDVYWMPELVEIAKSMDVLAGESGMAQNPENGLENKILNVIKFQKQHTIQIRDYPRDDNGNIISSPPPTNDRKHNGLDPVAIAMQSVFAWGRGLVSDIIGLNEIIPQPRVAAKVAEAADQQTRDATGYLYRMIDTMYRNLGITTLLLVSDVLEFKDTLPYNWLLTLIGKENIDALTNLEAIPAHRYGIFVKSVLQLREKEMIKQLAQQYVVNEKITMQQWMLIASTDDYRVAAKKMAYWDEKAKAEERKKIEVAQQNALQLQNNQFNLDMQKINANGQVMLQGKSIDADAAKYVADKGAESKVQIKQMTVDSEPEKQAAKSQGEKELVYAKADMKDQEAYGQ